MSLFPPFTGCKVAGNSPDWTSLRVQLDELVLKRPSEVTTTWTADELECDFSGALLVVVGANAGLEDVWSAVAPMLFEPGFPCYAEVDRYHVGFSQGE